MYRFYYISALFLCISCTKPYSSEIENVLKQAGDNRCELEKVLKRYSKNPADSLKLKAAEFLIVNMPGYVYYEGNLLNNYLSYFRLLRENIGTNHSPEELLDSVISRYGAFRLDSLRTKEDILTLDSAYLCNNIDWAFKVWHEQPWGKNVSFDDFCEYILPYRIGDEKPEYWREKFYREYNPMLEALRYESADVMEDPIQAVYLLMRHITNWKEIRFTTVSPADLPHVGASIARYKSGSCRELTDYAVYVCRALGIPCHIDVVPVRGNDNVGHFWISFHDKNRELYCQDFPETVTPVRSNKIREDAKTKVYRYTFGQNRSLKKAMQVGEASFPELFEQPRFVDVTSHYAKYCARQIHISAEQLYKRKQSTKIAYLCNSQHRDWTPVDWAPLTKEGLSFRNVQKGDIWRIAGWENNRPVYLSNPFRIDPLTNRLTFYAGQDSVQDVILHSKFSIEGEILFRSRICGGVFEGSNDAGFIHKDTLHVINIIPNRLLVKAKLKTKRPYRYVRFYGAEGSYCNISEAAFYETEQDTLPLTGKVVGTPGSFNPADPHEYTNVFDGKTWTSFDYKDGWGGWAGLDLGQSRNLFTVVYTPRNRDNYIRPGDTFELFYMDTEWKSLGIVESNSDSLLYRNVPRNALLYLKNHTRGLQERIFTYENGQQIWR